MTCMEVWFYLNALQLTEYTLHSIAIIRYSQKKPEKSVPIMANKCCILLIAFSFILLAEIGAATPLTKRDADNLFRNQCVPYGNICEVNEDCCQSLGKNKNVICTAYLPYSFCLLE
uniref:Uncharacterized protein n=1 Tax=Strigamia maritima TaxID=126957 RepID=T1IP35_STRMM